MAAVSIVPTSVKTGGFCGVGEAVIAAVGGAGVVLGVETGAVPAVAPEEQPAAEATAMIPVKPSTADRVRSDSIPDPLYVIRSGRRQSRRAPLVTRSVRPM